MAKVNEPVGLWKVNLKDRQECEHRIQGYPYADGGFMRVELEGGKGCIAYAMSEVSSWELTFDE